MGFWIFYILLWIAMLWALYNVVWPRIRSFCLAVIQALDEIFTYPSRRQRRKLLDRKARIKYLEMNNDILTEKIELLNDDPFFFHREMLKQ